MKKNFKSFFLFFVYYVYHKLYIFFFFSRIKPRYTYVDVKNMVDLAIGFSMSRLKVSSSESKSKCASLVIDNSSKYCLTSLQLLYSNGRPLHNFKFEFFISLITCPIILILIKLYKLVFLV